LHVCVVDGVFKPTNQGMQFFAAKPFSADFITQVQQTVRRRLLRAFVKRGYIDSADAKTMQSYAHGGGFSVDASVRIGQHDRAGLERLLRYCARPPFAGQRIRIEGEQIIYRCPKAPAGEQGGTSVGGKREHEIVLMPLEFIARIAALVPPPRQHRHRYYGVLAPNASQRGQVTPQVIPGVTAAEGDSISPLTTSDPTIGPKASSAHHQSRQLSRYGWAKLIARVYETDPLQCGRCGGRMKIIAFVVQASQIRQILAHVGLPTEAPMTHPARGPPQSDLWRSDLRNSATASEWEVNATYPNAADQDQSLHW
jgi:hypothetical protein